MLKNKMEMSPVVVGTDVMSVTFCVSAWFELLRRVYFRLEERTARQTCECFLMAHTILTPAPAIFLEGWGIE